MLNSTLLSYLIDVLLFLRQSLDRFQCKCHKLRVVVNLALARDAVQVRDNAMTGFVTEIIERDGWMAEIKPKPPVRSALMPHDIGHWHDGEGKQNAVRRHRTPRSSRQSALMRDVAEQFDTIRYDIFTCVQ